MTKLAELIEKRGTTIRQLSEQTGIPERTVYRHVSGRTKPDIDQAAAYAKTLKAKIEDLRDVAA